MVSPRGLRMCSLRILDELGLEETLTSESIAELSALNPPEITTYWA